MQQFLDARRAEERAKFEALVNTPLGEKAYRNVYNLPDNVPITNYVNNGAMYDVPDHVFTGFYNPSEQTFRDYADNVPNMQVMPANQAFALEDESYKYQDHFNF